MCDISFFFLRVDVATNTKLPSQSLIIPIIPPFSALGAVANAAEDAIVPFLAQIMAHLKVKGKILQSARRVN